VLPARAKKLATADFAASFDATMARKDLRLMLEEANRHGTELGVVPAVAAMLDAAIERGDGALDMVAMAKV
jgi:3-hydroxyisobutyrate dehydrogenase-like beta-hydroxyacid dehydrogenase